MVDKHTNLSTDVALIKKDIKQIERFFAKFDTALETMAEVSQKVAVMDAMAENTAEKLDQLEERMAEHKAEDKQRADVLHRRLEAQRISSRTDHQVLADETKHDRKARNAEIMTQLGKMNGSLDIRLSKIDDKISVLESWRWYVMGIGAGLVVLFAEINWGMLIGS
jgi:DNA repair exonuclease SbcCD ATPase subunit